MKNQSVIEAKKPSKELSEMFTRAADLSHVWDCRCEIQQLYHLFSAAHFLALQYLEEDVKDSFSTTLCLLAEKLNGCAALLTRAIEQSAEVKK